MFTVAYDYLLCVEKARLGSLALVTGLLVSIVLNYCLAPRWGLSGVVFSTVLANGIVLAAVMVLSQRAGMVWDTGVWCAGALPLTLCLGGWPALSILLVVFLAAWPARWVFEAGEASGILRQTIVSRAGGVQHVETG
jgi:O-antigen/teichoic acid export membrane protein